LWLVVARAGGFLGLLLTFRLAARFAGPGAGVVAALALLLTPDAESRWVRHMLQGNVEPLTIGLCLWAVERHLDGRHRQAALLAGAAALLRPEVWPFLLLYAAWLSWRRPPGWWAVLPTLPAAPLLWFGGDWWASGDPLTGAQRAQVLDTSTAHRVVLALDQIRDLVVAPVWVAAAVCVVVAAHRRVGPPVVLAVGALGWMAVVGVMTVVFGFGALSRFLAPPAAVLCVLAGIAVGWTVAAPRHVVLRVGVAALLAAVIVPFALPRVGWQPAQVGAAAQRAQLADDLDRAVALAGGRDAVLACGALAVDADRVEVQQTRPGLAWALDVPLARVGYGLGAAPGVAIVRTGGVTDTALAAQPAPTVRTLARTPAWTVYAQLCPQ
ncbi:MAG: hypothetical protein L0H64_17845, partial [Pseudonocardia sp.]|nr:hypothetical protein [Pseudonocardia sp.]